MSNPARRHPTPCHPILTLFALLSTILVVQAGARESFDWNWQFARFGPMPDGSHLNEPGQAASPARASSEETDKGNVAINAVDGDSDTRWCAASADARQWLQIDLGRTVPISAVEIEWELPLAYRYRVEMSTDQSSWKMIHDNRANNAAALTNRAAANGAARFVRVTTSAIPDERWASIRELRVLDEAGAPIKPQPTTATSMAPSDPKFADGLWRSLNLPHDWGIEGPFRADLPNETGKLPWPGIGWYRKSFFVPESDKGKQLALDFDGAMSHPKVFVNGQLAGEWAYGYSSFRVDITRFLRFGETNHVAVRLDNPPDSSRWYPGGGIYRHVWLVKNEPVHVAHWGVFVSTPEVSDQSATVSVATSADNASATEARVKVRQEIFDGKKSIASLEAEGVPVPAGGTASNQLSINIPKPKRWDITSPHLYTLRTTLLVDGKETDRVETPFGIRTVEWKPEGFFLNGRHVKLNGVCNHHDLGPLGTAVHQRAIERQLEILKEMGCNAIRTSHNPPAPELLAACDRMGFLVMDELFDAWKLRKKPNDYHLYFDAWHERDVVNLVRRDRNHPCVVIWSSGNEIPEQARANMHDVSRQLTALFHREDPTRKVTAGCNHETAAFNGFADTIDVYGYNYKPHRYAEFHQRRPNQPLMSTESSSCVSSRGEYFFPVETNKSKGFFNYQVSSYDLYAPGWAMKPDLEFIGQDKNPTVAGEFVWTGFDYFGEPTPYNNDESNALNFSDPEEQRKLMAMLRELGGKAPSRSSYFGIIDICGFPKDRYYIYQARWRPDLKMAHLLPHWNWPERAGQVTPVHLYTSGDEAELFLNGKSLGRRKKGEFDYRMVWDDVKYAPGELKAVAYKNGKRWATAVQRTIGEPAAVKLEPDRTKISGDGRDLSFVTVKIVDAKGNVVPRASNAVKFTVTGPAEIVAVDNGDATSHAAIQASEMNAYNGLALVILRSVRGGEGKVILTAAADNLKTASTKIMVQRGKYLPGQE